MKCIYCKKEIGHQMWNVCKGCDQIRFNSFFSDPEVKKMGPRELKKALIPFKNPQRKK